MSGSRPDVCAIVCAAGSGSRAGFPKNKLLVPFGGETTLFRTLSAFDFPAISEILVPASETDFDEISSLCRRFPRTRAVKGGETRAQSVYNALKQTESAIVLVHDGARPFVSRAVVEGCVESVLRGGSGICAVPATDTVALSGGDGKISSVPPRSSAFCLQTPQGFYTKDLLRAYERAFSAAEPKSYTDDSSVYADYISAPLLCAGSRDNIKLTYAEDFASAYARTGFGVDTHAFGKPQNHVVLAGVKIPSDSGFIAHSDGDVAVHAVMDAMLSAAGLKDIGFYFPDSDDEWLGADSMLLLERVRRLVEERGFAVKNLSVAIQAEKPRLKNYIDEMRRSLASALGLDANAVGITAGTNEKLGYVGEGKGVTVYASVLLRALPPLPLCEKTDL